MKLKLLIIVFFCVVLLMGCQISSSSKDLIIEGLSPDFAGGKITSETAFEALGMLEVDEEGLDQMDKRILRAILREFNGGPVGIGTLSVAVGEEEDTLEEIYEPYLIQKGYLKRTPQGRVLTPRAYERLGEKRADSQTSLW